MNRRDWLNSGLIIFGLLILAILVAQSRRNCEIPGSSWVPCIWGEPLKSNKGVVIIRCTETRQQSEPSQGTMLESMSPLSTLPRTRTTIKIIARPRAISLPAEPGVTVRYWCEHGKFTQ